MGAFDLLIGVEIYCGISSRKRGVYFPGEASIHERKHSRGNCVVVVFSSVQFIRSVVSDSATPWIAAHQASLSHHQLPEFTQTHVRQWCHPAISSSVVPFSSCTKSLPDSESFPMSQCFTWGGQSTGVSALASFLPTKSQDWSPLDWTGWILEVVLCWCKSNCGFALWIFAVWYWNTFLNKCGYVIHHINTHFSLYAFFASDLLVAIYLMCILD